MPRLATTCLLLLLMPIALGSAEVGTAGGAASVDSLSAGGIPTRVVAAGLDVIRSRAGGEFTECWVRLDPVSSEVWLNGLGDLRYTLVFRIVIPDLDVDSSSIRFTLDDASELVPSPPPEGIPECLSLPEACQPAIHRTHALAIAKKDIMAGSQDDWSVEFLWHPEFGFVWEVVQRWPTNPEGMGSYRIVYKAIDARDGEVVKSYWSIATLNRC